MYGKLCLLTEVRDLLALEEVNVWIFHAGSNICPMQGMLAGRCWVCLCVGITSDTIRPGLSWSSVTQRSPAWPGLHSSWIHHCCYCPRGFSSAGLGAYKIHKIEIKETAPSFIGASDDQTPPPGILSVFVFPSLLVIRKCTICLTA